MAKGANRSKKSFGKRTQEGGPKGKETGNIHERRMMQEIEEVGEHTPSDKKGTQIRKRP